MIFRRIKNWLSHILNSTRATEHAHASTQTMASAPQTDDHELYEEYPEKLNGLDDIVEDLQVHKRMSASHKYMYEMGKRDGSAGIRLEITDMARATAHSMFQRIFVMLKGRLGSLDAHLQSEKNIMEVEEKLYRHEQAYCDYVTYQYRFFPRNYSFLLAAGYLIVALALIAADLPLALKLIQKGFDIPGTGFEELFMEGKFWDTMASNWETAVTALGIALCTVYIKIFYDEYVGTPYASRLMSFKKFLEENGFEQHDEKAAKKISIEANIKLGIKTALVIVTIVCIVVLALFRNETNAEEVEKPKYYAQIAFLAITILFPVIGGVCLSYALNNLQNRMRLIRAKRACSKRLKILREEVKKYTQAKNNYEDMFAAAARLGDENKMVEEYKDYLVAFYKRGYALGAMLPEKHVNGEDFYTKVLEWRNVAISRTINHSINKLN